MRAFRVFLALLLSAGPAQAQPVVDLLTRYAVPADETAASAPEGEAPQGSGKKLAELEADLAIVSEGLEAFAHPQDAAKALLAAKPRLPAGTAPLFRDRATALDSLYRTLAVVDYTWALRFPNPPCSPAEKRGELLRSDDGLFVDRVSGQTSAWMTALLGPVAKGKDLEAVLDRASAPATPSQAEYARLRARQNLITKALGSADAVGEARARLYCKRAETRVRLAAANRASEQVLAARASEAKASRHGVVIVAGKTPEGLEARGAGVVVDTKSGVRVLTDRRLGGGDVVALVDGRAAPVPLTVEREDVPSGLLLLRPEGDVGEALNLAEAAPEKDDLVFAFAHSERLGAWTRTQGLVTRAGSNQFQTDAVADASMTGGAVLDEEGRLVGLLVLRRDEAGEWPVAIPSPALKYWIAGGGGPAAEPAVPLDAGTTKILTASRPLLDSLSVGKGAITAARAADIYTPTPWGTVRGVCKANCEDSAPATSYSGGSDGSREVGEALGKLAAVGLQALIFKGIPALFRGIGSMFKSKPRSSSPKDAPAAFVEKKPEPPKPKPELLVTLSPASVLPGKEVVFVLTVKGKPAETKISGLRVDFTVSNDMETSTGTAVTDETGTAVLRITPSPAARSFVDLQRESDRHPVLINTGRETNTEQICKIVLPGSLAIGMLTVAAVLAPTPEGLVIIYAGGPECLAAASGLIAGAGAYCTVQFGKEALAQSRQAPAPSYSSPAKDPSPVKKAESAIDAVRSRAAASDGQREAEESKHSDEAQGANVGDAAPPQPPNPDDQEPERDSEESEREINISQDRLEHIVERHWKSSDAAGAGKFAEGTRGRDLLQLIRETARLGRISPNTQGRPGRIFEHVFKDNIGRNSNGAPSNRLRLIVAPNGSVITAFPF